MPRVLFARQILAVRGSIPQYPLDILWRAQQRGRSAVRRAVHQRQMHGAQTGADHREQRPFLCDDGMSGHQLMPRPTPARLDRLTGHKEPVVCPNRRRHFFVRQLAGSQAHGFRDKRIQPDNAFSGKNLRARLFKNPVEQRQACVQSPLFIDRERPRLRLPTDAKHG